MSVTTYIEEGLADARTVLRNIVRDLTGAGTPLKGTAAAHMRVIYPEGFDTSTDSTEADIMVVLEANTAIDPFADDTGSGSPSTDPWRLVLHCQQWQKKALWDSVNVQEVPDTTQVYSLAMYVGTPSTIVINPTTNKPVLAWSYGGRDSGTPPSYAGLLNGGSFNPWPQLGSYTPNARYLVEPIGNIGDVWTNTFDPTDNASKYSQATIDSVSPPYQSPRLWEGPDITNPTQVFLNKYVTSGPKTSAWAGFGADTTYANVTSYRIVTTDHGLFLGCWGPDPEENGKGFNWLLIQRPVDKEDGIVRGINKQTGLPYAGELNPDTGLPYPIGNRPLFCVYSVGGKYGKYVVREHDNPVPTTRKDATRNTTDSGAVINPYQQQSLTENGEYVITFLNNLNSSRFRYSDELDMLGTVSSDVVGGGSSIDVSVYSEQQKRTYHALWSSGSFGTRMRVMVVEDIPAPRTPVAGGDGGGGGQ